VYLPGIKDLYTCEVVGHAMGPRITTELVTRALTAAVCAKRPRPGLLHHSDRGAQYCAHDYQARLKQFGVRVSMSRRGSCYDNAPMESFWGTLKNELVHHRRDETREQAQREITEYIEIFYNRQRRHSKLGIARLRHLPWKCAANRQSTWFAHRLQWQPSHPFRHRVA
jgi:putative transposase